MRILVFVKQVPDTPDVSMNKDYTINRAKARMVINPADCCALEKAFALREQCGAHITVMTMGPDKSLQMLREIAALPVDELYLISDHVFAGSDTLCTARILSAAAEKTGKYDLIITGRRAFDGETGHVGPSVAAILNMHCVTNTTEITYVDGGVVCVRLLEGEKHKLKVPAPAVITVCGIQNRLRPPSLSGLRCAKDKEIKIISNKDLKLPQEKTGLAGSPTRVRRIEKEYYSGRQPEIYKDMVSGAERLAEVLMESHAVPNRCIPCNITSNGKLAAVVGIEGETNDIAMVRSLAALSGGMGLKPVVIWVESGKKEANYPSGFADIHRITLESIHDDAVCAQAISRYIRKIEPCVVLFSATIRGRAIAPICAAILETGLTADCTGLSLDETGRLIQRRPAFGGSVIAEIVTSTMPQMATVRPGAIISLDCEMNQTNVNHTAESDNCRSKIELIDRQIIQGVNLLDAERIIAGGRGIGGKNEFNYMIKLAGSLGCAVGASRSAVDSGYAEYDYQIGQTGITVRPNVYIACGISGSIQHFVGMRESKIIVSINIDPKAPIVSQSDIAIIAPWKETLEATVGLINRRE